MWSSDCKQKMAPKAVLVFLLFWAVSLTSGRIHHLVIKDDSRLSFPLSHFGFLKGGVLDVRISNLSFTKNGADFPRLGLELERTLSDATTPYLDDRQAACAFDQPLKDEAATAHFLFDFEAKLLKVSCSPRMQSIARDNPLDDPRNKRNFMSKKLSDSSLFSSRRRRQPAPDSSSTISSTTEIVEKPAVESNTVSMRCEDLKFPIQETSPGVYSTKFTLHIFTEEQEGLYNLYFHNCGDNRGLVAVNSSMEVIESNGENYLSAGEMPLPRLYFVMSTIFLASGCFWVGILCKSKNIDTYKIHYLMALLVFLKSLSLAFHGINFHYIQTEGYHIEAWAVLYYITHLLKGAVLFITIILIGTGWAFVKHILSGKDKKIFMIVVPLQVLANVAYIITEESEAGQVMHMTWGEIFILVDLLCCGAILFPVVWSIRHLQEASQTDGKAAANLQKLKLFRHFYIMVVCYIYFTRIIVYLLKITVPFRYEWFDELFYELATFVFFVTTGISFRPATNNPYLQLAKDEDEELPLDEVVTQTGLTATVVHVNKKNKKIPKDGKKEEHESLVNAESSHEYD